MTREFALYEYVDMEKLDKVLQSPLLKEATRKGLNEYRRRVKRINNIDRVEVKYQKMEYARGIYLGRYYANEYSISKMWRAIRAELYSDTEYDIDIENCNPSILIYICTKNGITYKHLGDYVKNRDIFLNYIPISDEYILNWNKKNKDCRSKKDLQKLFYIELFYGASKETLIQLIERDIFKEQTVLQELYEEIKQISNKLTNLPKYLPIVRIFSAKKLGEGKRTHLGSELSIIVFNYEAQIVKQAIDFMEARKHTVTSYVYDGFQIRGTNREQIEEDLAVYNSMQPLKFIIKDFSTKLSDLNIMDYDIKPDQILADTILNDYEQLIIDSLSMTTYDVAKVIYTRYREKFSYIEESEWYYFNDTNYKWIYSKSGIDLEKRISTEVYQDYQVFADKYTHKSKDIKELAQKLKDKPFKNKIMSELKLIFHDKIGITKKFDKNKNLLGFNNGTYDLEKNEFRAGIPEDYVTLSVGYTYPITSNEIINRIRLFINDDRYIRNDKMDKDELDEILNFLYDVFNSKEVIDFELFTMASFLRGKNSSELFHIWSGCGGNGKSKLIELLRLSLNGTNDDNYKSGYYQTIPISLLTEKRPNANTPSPELYKLRGCLIVVAQEPENNAVLNMSLVKELTGGDEISSRDLYKSSISFKPTFNIIMTCNKKPKVPTDSEGSWRRVIVSEFQSRFVNNPKPDEPLEKKRDNHISDKLIKWKELFMVILLEYWKVLQNKQYEIVIPKSIQDSNSAYRMQNDYYQEFIEKYLTKTTSGFIQLGTIYAIFKTFYKDEISENNAPTKKVFKQELENRLHHKFDNYSRLTCYKLL